MPPISIIGPASQIGSELVLRFPNATPVFRSKLNLLNPGSVSGALASERSSLIIYAAGITDLEYCEEYPHEAHAIHELSVRETARHCLKTSAHMVLLSDSMVFNGQSSDPYTINDTPAPINVYGNSKYAGERAAREILGFDHLTIVRAGSVFGPALGRMNWLEKLIKSAMRCKSEVKVNSWRMITPTSASVVAQAIKDAVGRAGVMPPILNAVCAGGPVTQAEAAAFALEQIPSLQHLKVAPASKPSRNLPRIPAMTALALPTASSPPHWQTEVREYLLQKGYARPQCVLDVEAGAPLAVTQVWEKLQRSPVSIETLVVALRKDRLDWMAGASGPGRKAKKSFFEEIGGGQKEEEE